jgi:hypothetical protein
MRGRSLLGGIQAKIGRSRIQSGRTHEIVPPDLSSSPGELIAITF